jgi:hypothetical protein
LAIRRFLSLWLPRLATDRARRLSGVDKAAPLAAVAKVNNAERLVCVDAEAARLGLTVGLPLADARARHPNLVAVEAAPAEEARLLERLCDWCSRFTPLAALDGRDGLSSTFPALRISSAARRRSSRTVARGLSRKASPSPRASPAIRAPPGRWRGFRKRKSLPSP